ncbi:MAG: choline dehydrogenase [Gammaproteobacteria bacterium]|nr:choline dehydrogenase [Gammaproteobacteria bacterium]
MQDEFDYIIIGAGSAGCVLADRLSASGRHRVLVVEAGGSDKRFWIQTPIGYGKTFYDEKVNWKYITEPDAGLNNRRSYWPRGKVIGGSSSINAMVYIRGQQQDYEDWRELGNPGWGWQDVLPYFRKSETFSDGGDEYRGDSGPLYVNNVSSQYHPLCQSFFEAAGQNGIDYNPDFNSGDQEGVGFYQITTRDGRRMSAARAYLHPALKRPNCDVIKQAQVTRILFADRIANGVEYISSGQTRQVKADREVIVSAGAINSPQLLQLSGIGDAGLLKRFGIEPLHQLPGVGRNLQDHLDYSIYYRSRVPTLNNQLRPWTGKLLAGVQYLLLRNGLLSLSINQAGGFVRSHPSRPRPNMQMYFAAMTYTRAPPGERPLLQPDPFPGFLISIGLTRPSSRGHLQIDSPEPTAPVKIYPNYLSSGDDITQMLEGARLLRQLASMPALAELIESETRPGHAVQSDDQFIEDIRQRADTVFHPSCTCMMGPDPETAVVDAKCRVYGVDRLRVVDTSIFPTVTSGNTNAPTIMVAEKAADMILAESG